MTLIIEEGQHWETRGGAIVRVTKDRGLELVWRWALSNSFMAAADGHVDFSGKPHHSDLVSLQPRTI